jgi:acyl carrier protein
VADVRSIVLGVIARICGERGLPAVALSDSDVLGEGGLELDSLDMATVVAELDAVLGKDPFAEGFPQFRTVGEFIRLYESEPGQ